MTLNHAEQSEHFGRSVLFAVRYALVRDDHVAKSAIIYLRDTMTMIQTPDLVLIEQSVNRARKRGVAGQSNAIKAMWAEVERQVVAELESRPDHGGTHWLKRPDLELLRDAEGVMYCPDCGGSASKLSRVPIQSMVYTDHAKLACPTCGWFGIYPKDEYRRAMKPKGGEGNG